LGDVDEVIAGRPQSVALDVTPCLSGQTGVARYVRELDAGLVRLGLDVHRFAIGRSIHPPPADTKRLLVPMRIVHRGWAALGWPSVERLTGAVDVVHATDLVPPPAAAPVVLTVHDLAALDHPKLHPPRAVKLQRAQVAAAQRSNAVIAGSRATAAALARRGVDPDRVTVVAYGATRLPTPSDPPFKSGTYILGVGALAARKGWEVLFEAFSAARLHDLKLVIAGLDGFGADRIRAAARRSSACDRIVLLGAVNDATLAGLYRDCLAVCLPSWDEGFGLTVVEACAADAPLLLSDIAVLRETGADAAWYAAPGDVGAWALMLQRAADEPAALATLSSRRRQIGAAYTWDRCARETVSVYESAIARFASFG